MPTPGTSLYWVATSLLHHVVVDPDVQGHLYPLPHHARLAHRHQEAPGLCLHAQGAKGLSLHV